MLKVFKKCLKPNLPSWANNELSFNHRIHFRKWKPPPDPPPIFGNSKLLHTRFSFPRSIFCKFLS